MSALDRLVNGCLLPGFPGPDLPQWVAEGLEAGLPGAVLFTWNLTGPGAVARLAGAVRERRSDALVAVDEEGGDVTRLDYPGGSRFPGNLALGVADDPDLTTEVARAMGAVLRDAEVNLDLAPSVDVNSDPDNPIIGVRAFGSDPQLVSTHGSAFIRGLQGAGVAACAKHFPGHGATRTDSHHGLPVIDCDEATFRRRELPPFAAAVDAGVAAIMSAHVVFSALEPVPATLSPKLLTGVLRGELGFDGVVITDALGMAAVRDQHGTAGAAVQALRAGADLLLVGTDDDQAACGQIREAVAAAVADGTLPRARLEQAGERVQALRQWAAAARPDALHPAGDVGLAAARRAVRVAGTGLPLPGPAFVAEVHGAGTVVTGPARRSLAATLDALDALAGSVDVTAEGPSADDVVAAAGDQPLVIATRDAARHDWGRDWIAAVLAARPDAVLAALGMPTDAALTTGTTVCAFGAGQVNLRAAAERLSGPAASA